MDKETLSNYGWIVVLVLILAVMMALAGPFGAFIADGFQATTAGFFYTNDNALTNTLDDLGVVPSLDELQSKYKFEYYSSLALAVDDINAGTIGKHADVNKEHAVAGIYQNGGNTYAVLLKDNTETRIVAPSVDMTINLGGHTLTGNEKDIIQSTANNLAIDGRLEGSTIKKESGNTTISLIRTMSSNNSLFIEKGNYIINTSQGISSYGIIIKGNATVNNIDVSVSSLGSKSIGIQFSGTDLNVNDSNIVVQNSKASAGGILAQSTNVNINNCRISVEGYQTVAIPAETNLTITNSTVEAIGSNIVACIQTQSTGKTCIISDSDLIANGPNGQTVTILINSIATIQNSTMQATGKTATAFQNNEQGTSNIDNCILTTNATTWSVSIITKSNTTITNSTINSTGKTQAYCIEHKQKTLKMNNCKMYSKNSQSGIGVYASNNSKAEITDCLIDVKATNLAYGIYTKSKPATQTNCQITVSAPTSAQNINK